MNNIHTKVICINLVILLILFSFTGCSNPDTKQSLAPISTEGMENSKNKQEVDLYNINNVKDKLAIWFFSLPGNDHTGEAILIKTAEGKIILIDSGIPEVGRLVTEYLSKLGITKIDYAIATHMHIDHIGGFPIIMDSVKVDKVFTSKFAEYNTTPVNAFNVAISRHNIPVEAVNKQRTLEVDRYTKIEFLHPDETFSIPKDSNQLIDGNFLNDSSVVFKLTYNENAFLFTGDITSDVEDKLINRYGSQLEADLIKVPHHGAATSSSLAFIKAVKPKYSVMCIYAFNDFAVYDRYKAVGNRPYITSLDGTLLLTSDGKDIKIQVEKERKGMLK